MPSGFHAAAPDNDREDKTKKGTLIAYGYPPSALLSGFHSTPPDDDRQDKTPKGTFDSIVATGTSNLNYAGIFIKSMLLLVGSRQRLSRPVQRSSAPCATVFHALRLSNGISRRAQRTFALYAPCPTVIKRRSSPRGFHLCASQKNVARRGAHYVMCLFIHARALRATACVC